MPSTDPSRAVAAFVHAHSAAIASRPSGAGGGIAGILRTIEGSVGGLSNIIGGAFSGNGATGLVSKIAKTLLGGFFDGLSVWVANGASSLVGVLGNALSASTRPVLAASAFRSEFGVMAVLSAGIALPLLAAGTIQAIARQEPGALLKSALVRLPLALLFTAVSVQLVALGLAATDQASSMVLGAAGDPTHRLLTGLVTALGRPGSLGLAAFGGFLVVLAAAVVAFVLWLELAVRSAAIAAASLFLPLALAGLAWPATSHWARRLGETLTALVLSKFAIASVLALAAGLLETPSGVAGVVAGIALLAVAAFSPFALLRLVPAVEAGAVSHLEGLSRRPAQAAQRMTRMPGGGELDLGTLAVAAVRGSGRGSTGNRSGDDGGRGPFIPKPLPPQAALSELSPLRQERATGTSGTFAGPAAASAAPAGASTAPAGAEAAGDGRFGSSFARLAVALSQGRREDG